MTSKGIKLTINLSPEANNKLRRHNRYKGDLSRIIEKLIIENLQEPTT